ncbi:MAG: hypothetical protein SFY80_12995 [Verrucomicrobiota bacterium]|nr:hypothetical protein [Verrucomicrobiota bacterium]
MPIIRNVKYRKPRLGSDDADMYALAQTMRASNQTALAVDCCNLIVQDFKFLQYFSGISHLTIQGSVTDCDFSHIPISVQDICLLEVNMNSYEALAHLENLKVLDHRAHTIASCHGLELLTSLKVIQFQNLNGISDLSHVSSLSNLQWIKFSSCNDIVKIPALSGMSSLKRIVIETCNNLIDINAISTAPALEDLIIIESELLGPHHFMQLAESKVPIRILPGIGNIKSFKYIEACKIINSKLITCYYGSDFEYYEATYDNSANPFKVKAS